MVRVLISLKENEKGITRRTAILCIALLFFLGNTVFSCNRDTKQSAETQKLNYELQERCGQRADELCKDEYHPYLGYCENHYNTRLNKCFILIKDSIGGDQTEMMIDANEKKVYGAATAWPNGSFSGRIQNNPCKDRKEWDAFVKRMMEE